MFVFFCLDEIRFQFLNSHSIKSEWIGLDSIRFFDFEGNEIKIPQRGLFNSFSSCIVKASDFLVTQKVETLS